MSPSASSPVDIAEHDLSSSSSSDDGAAQQPESPLARKKGQTLPVEISPSRPRSESPEKTQLGRLDNAGSPWPTPRSSSDSDVVSQRLDELGGLFVGFAFALQ